MASGPCMGSTVVQRLLRRLVARHGYPVADWIDFEFLRPMKMMKNPYLRAHRREPGRGGGMPAAVRNATAEAARRGETAVFKLESGKGMYPGDEAVRVLAGQGARAVAAVRDNVLDTVVCTIRDCFFNKAAGSAVSLDGAPSRLCFKRRKAESKRELEAAPQAAAAAGGGAAESAGAAAEAARPVPVTKAKLVCGPPLLKALSNHRHQNRAIVRRAASAFGANQGGKVASADFQELIAFEYLDGPGGRNATSNMRASVGAWLPLLAGAGVPSPDAATVEAALRESGAAQRRARPHADTVYNAGEARAFLCAESRPQWVRELWRD